MKMRPAKLFNMAWKVMLVLGIITKLFFPNSAIDIQMHDTYFVISYFHICCMATIILGVFTVIYLLYPKMFGRNLRTSLGYLHFFLTIICIPICSYLFVYIGMPRRYYDFDSFDAFRTEIESLNIIALSLIIISQVPFIINLIWSYRKGKKV